MKNTRDFLNILKEEVQEYQVKKEKAGQDGLFDTESFYSGMMAANNIMIERLEYFLMQV